MCENLLYCGNCQWVDCRERDDSCQYAWLCSVVRMPCTLHTVIHLRALSQGAQGQCLLVGACPMVLSCYTQQRQKWNDTECSSFCTFSETFVNVLSPETRKWVCPAFQGGATIKMHHGVKYHHNYINFTLYVLAVYVCYLQGWVSLAKKTSKISKPCCSVFKICVGRTCISPVFSSWKTSCKSNTKFPFKTVYFLGLGDSRP